MKKFALLCAVVCLSIGAIAQTAPAEGVSTTNIVCVEARHADGTPFYHHCGHNLKTTAGIDFMATAIGSSAYPYSSLGPPEVINLSNDSASPAAGDCVTYTSSCTFPGVLQNSGMLAATATYAHTAGTSTYTLTHTWTATGTVSNIQKVSVSWQPLASGGGGCSVGPSGPCSYIFENTFTPVSLSANDQLQVTWTVTIS